MTQAVFDECEMPQLVAKMHDKFGIDYNGPPRVLCPDEKGWRVAAMREEIDEYEEATTLVDEYDALLDLLVFAIGCLDKQGLPITVGFKSVMDANLRKELAPEGLKDQSIQRSRFKVCDLRKPPGWTGPEERLAWIIGQLGGNSKVRDEDPDGIGLTFS